MNFCLDELGISHVETTQIKEEVNFACLEVVVVGSLIFKKHRDDQLLKYALG